MKSAFDASRFELALSHALHSQVMLAVFTLMSCRCSIRRWQHSVDVRKKHSIVLLLQVALHLLLQQLLLFLLLCLLPLQAIVLLLRLLQVPLWQWLVSVMVMEWTQVFMKPAQHVYTQQLQVLQSATDWPVVAVVC